MPNPYALVDTVSNRLQATEATAIRQAQRQLMTVSFQGGQSAFLDTVNPRSQVWADVLDSVQQTNQPVYVEIDPATNVITQLLVPLVVQVASLNLAEAGDEVEVELVISHARHYLRRSNPDFQYLLTTLQAAQAQGTTVAVTESPTDHEIIDVRPLPGTTVLPTMLPPPFEITPAVAAVSPQQAQQFFNLVNSKICCPASATAPCIPFLYPDDGCWGRAHEMCRLMLAAGAQPEKVWIYGNLRVATSNNPRCEVRWGWHVAPTLLVNTGTGTEVQVIDPSLFPGPVAKTTWANVQGDPSARLEPSSATVFYRSQGGGVVQYDDAAYTRTNQVLNTYRNQLRLRSVGSDGPPPYIQCLTKPAGVQWFGTIAPNATQRWYTWGWPASQHVFWTIMPITPCPGGPQLTWKVQVERANATQCTYWISVTNLTADTVRFEGRYDILSK